MNSRQSIRQRLFGLAAGLFLGTKTPSVNMKKGLFKESAQRIGVQFTEQLRDAFRKKWLKIQ
ncbi:MAG TPA: hypothetical protein PKY88_11225 [Anaerohalosphaeraceae bacterium]|nr:hypothetical protein [Anaerohalosphaeraceae bacterium]